RKGTDGVCALPDGKKPMRPERPLTSSRRQLISVAWNTATAKLCANWLSIPRVLKYKTPSEHCSESAGSSDVSEATGSLLRCPCPSLCRLLRRSYPSLCRPLHQLHQRIQHLLRHPHSWFLYQTLPEVSSVQFWPCLRTLCLGSPV